MDIIHTGFGEVITKADLHFVLLLEDDIVFESVIWTQHSRGLLRCGIGNIRFSDIIIRREGPAPQGVALRWKIDKLTHVVRYTCLLDWTVP